MKLLELSFSRFLYLELTFICHASTLIAIQQPFRGFHLCCMIFIMKNTFGSVRLLFLSCRCSVHIIVRDDLLFALASWVHEDSKCLCLIKNIFLLSPQKTAGIYLLMHLPICWRTADSFLYYFIQGLTLFFNGFEHIYQQISKSCVAQQLCTSDKSCKTFTLKVQILLLFSYSQLDLTCA